MCGLLNSKMRPLALAFLTLALSLSAAPLKLTLSTVPGLQFDKPRFTAEPGQEIELTFKNPDDMAHNLVFTQPGQRMAVVQATIALPPDPDRIIKHTAILTQTPTLKPNASAVLKFTAPKTKGIYPYVCTLPGHGLLMYGAMYVGETMPDLAKDEHVPPMARAKGANSNLHAWPHRRPLMYRIFMPDASPAAIAVALPHGVSYCWDAGNCRLRYAWIGGFVDPMPVWRANGNGLATIIGNKFWTATETAPLQVGRALQKVEFKGYRKIKGHPEFHYTLNGLDVYEHITALPDGTGIIRHFRIPKIVSPLRVTPGHGEIDAEMSNGVAVLSPNQAETFTITHRHQHGK